MLPAILAAASIGTGVAGMLRKPQNYGYSKGDLDYLAAQRSGQIDSFAKQLAALRAKYASQISSFGNNTFNRFMPQAEANFAGRGLQVSGGAYASALARKAAELQDSENMQLMGLENSDLKSVDAARAGAYSSQLGGNPSAPSPDAGAEALGMLSSGLGSAAWNLASQPSAQPQPGMPRGSIPTPGGLAPVRRSVFSRKLDLGMNPVYGGGWS